MKVRIFKRGNNWCLDYRPFGKSGPRRRETLGPDKRTAEAVAAKRQVEVAEGRYLDKVSVSSTTFGRMARQYLEWSRATKRSWKRDQTSLRALSRSFKGKRLADITPKAVEQYKTRRSTEVSPQSVNHELQCLRHMFELAVTWGDATANPAAKVKKLQVRNTRLRYLSESEEAAIMEYAAPHLRPMITLAIHTGLREGELLRLQWSDIDLDEGLIHIEDTKNGRPRSVPMSATARSVLASHPRHIRTDYVFTKVTGQPYGRVDKAMRGACRRAGLKDVVFHTLRHTFASRLVMAGADLITVREPLGHSSLAMVMRYAHLSPEHRERAIAALDRYSSALQKSMSTA